jgi:isoquinoline 1-oxidoreductase beta subunit
MADAGESRGISRRTLLVGGGAGAGLVLAWALWPRSYRPNLRAAPGESLFNAFLKIGADGRVTVAVPQAELGQGVYTSLPQILADELGADWRTVAVEPSPIHPLYANTLMAGEAGAAGVPSFMEGVGRWVATEYATRNALMLTGGSTSIRAFEAPMREAGAGARALLMKAAARKWNVDWETLDTVLGFVINGGDNLSFAELAEAAAKEDLPRYLPIRGGVDNRLAGQPVPRLDLPAKVDGSAEFAGDVRLKDMVYASVRGGPTEASRLKSVDKAAAMRVPGVVAVFENPGWAGAAASNWWAAEKALKALKPVFDVPGGLPDSDAMESALAAGLEREGDTIFERGDAAAALAGAGSIRAHYAVGPAASAPLETLTATARLRDGRLEIWAPAQAPGLARAAAARAAGLAEADVTLYRPMIGGGYGRKIEVAAVEQAAAMAARLKRPVQLVYSRIEETLQDGFRAPAHAVLQARLGEAGMILGWHARIAAPDTGAEVAERLGPASGTLFGGGEAVAGAVPPYGIPSVTVEHVEVPVPIRTGLWRGGAHSYTAFFTETFLDELARVANVEPLSFRMQMLGDNPRLARCLSTAAGLGGWDGGQKGSDMGLAAHSAFGSHIALLVEVEAAPRIRVTRVVAAVDCGRVINPEIVKQQVEGAILHGIAAATGTPIRLAGGRPKMVNFGGLGFPGLKDSPEVTVEIVASEEEPGGVTELGVPVAAPAIGNALFAATGRRHRSLPFVAGAAS